MKAKISIKPYPFWLHQKFIVQANHIHSVCFFSLFISSLFALSFIYFYCNLICRIELVQRIQNWLYGWRLLIYSRVIVSERLRLDNFASCSIHCCFDCADNPITKQTIPIVGSMVCYFCDRMYIRNPKFYIHMYLINHCMLNPKWFIAGRANIPCIYAKFTTTIDSCRVSFLEQQHKKYPNKPI